MSEILERYYNLVIEEGLSIEDSYHRLTKKEDDEKNKLELKIESALKMREKVKKQLKRLPINCRVCGKRLTMGGTYPHGVSWGCSGMLEGDEYGWVEGRKPADKHYSDSRTFMEFKDFERYEYIEGILKGLLK